MKRTYSTLALVSLFTLLPAPIALAVEEPIQIASLASDDLELYFDEAERTTVESATHAPKPITQVAENISVITSQDIEAWNAHSLADVLAHVPGVLVNSMGRDVNNWTSIQIQGSDYRDVQIYLDGMRFNDPVSDYTITAQIPVEIIERVEVIKGPASSTWGSAMGGVINIITKSAGSGPTPSGTLTASLGERQTHGASAQVAGTAGSVGYFLHGGLLDSDGQKDDRWLDNDSQFAKLSTPLGSSTLTVSMGRFYLDQISLAGKDYPFPGTELLSRWNETTRFATATLNRSLGGHLHIQFAGALIDKPYTNTSTFLSASSTTTGDYSEGEKARSGALRLYGDLGRHSISLGAEINHNSFDEASNGTPGPDKFYSETWALYANDTIHLGHFTLTPGLRYDANSIADPQLCPSLGLTYRLTDSTLLRALAARGFLRPSLVDKFTNYSWYGDDINPDLDSETVRTYQAGLENTSLSFLRVKATLFRHEVDHRWVSPPAGSNLTYINGNGQVRNGVELELESERWQGLALIANHTYVSYQPEDADPDPGDLAFSNLIFDYRGPWGLSGRLSGNYTWLNTTLADPGWGGRFNTMTWDLTATKRFDLSDRYRLDLFASAYNLFNGSQYDIFVHQNAERWLEAGLRLHF